MKVWSYSLSQSPVWRSTEPNRPTDGRLQPRLAARAGQGAPLEEAIPLLKQIIAKDGHFTSPMRR